jgi:hypothetical protein
MVQHSMAQQSHSADRLRAEMEPRRERAEAAMPAALRFCGIAALLGVLGGASYLLAVRGEALLLDLAAVSQRIFCF